MDHLVNQNRLSICWLCSQPGQFLLSSFLTWVWPLIKTNLFFTFLKHVFSLCFHVWVYLHACVCMSVYVSIQACYSVHVKVREQYVGVSFLLPAYGSRNQKVVTVGSKLLYPLSHLSLPLAHFGRCRGAAVLLIELVFVCMLGKGSATALCPQFRNFNFSESSSKIGTLNQIILICLSATSLAQELLIIFPKKSSYKIGMLL